MQILPSTLKTFPRDSQWQTAHFQQQPFTDLALLHNFADLAAWPTVQDLHQVLQNSGIGLQQQDTAASTESRYYEEIVFQDRRVPTRSNNWHDFYNACIWGMFPQTKAKLNQLHIEEIRQFGLTPRTPRRDRITHFDECGVVLAYSCPAISTSLQAHEWQQVWLQRRADWLPETRRVRAYVFGHANYEMLMQPYIGLTGKWLGVAVAPDFWQATLAQQYRLLDTAVVNWCAAEHSFAHRGQLSPLPLLGVPGWSALNQTPTFYQNTQYFRGQAPTNNTNQTMR